MSSPPKHDFVAEKKSEHDGGLSSAEEGSNFAIDRTPSYAVAGEVDDGSNEADINYRTLEWW